MNRTGRQHHSIGRVVLNRLPGHRSTSRLIPAAVVRWLILLLWAAGGFLFSAVKPAAAAESDAPLRLEFLQLTSEPFSGLLTRFKRPVSLQVRVTNLTDAPLMLERAGLQMFCDDEQCRETSPSGRSLFTDDQLKLPPGESADGWIAFRVDRSTSTEPSLKLLWEVGTTTQSVSLNRVLRELINVRVKHVGFEQRIAIMSISRRIDLMTMWVLDEQFRRLRAQGVDRLVLDADAEQTTRLPPKIASWLLLANRTAVANRKVIVRGFPAPVQFVEFHVTGFQHGSGTVGSVMHETRELAVAAVARTLYEQLPTQTAAAELESPEPGIRRAALESCIDRLSSADLSRVLNSLRSGFSTDRRLILEMLDRVSDPLGLQTLRRTLLSYLESSADTSDSFDLATAAVAARTLVRCIGPETDRVMSEVWAAADDRQSLRDIIIDEVLQTADYRWIDLVADFAATRLEQSAAEQPNSGEASEQPPRQAGTSRLLRNALRFLHNDHPAFAETARQRLPEVTVPEIQDELLRIVVDSGETQLPRECILRRLDAGTITKTLLAMIHRLPDSTWTTRLAELHRSKHVPRHYRAPTLMAAVRCATDDQLDAILDGVDQFDRTTRSQLFRQLMTMDHPRCLELLKKSLDGNETEFSTALSSLTIGMTPQILQLLVDRYEQIRQAALSQGALEGSDYRLAATLLAQLGQVDHPQARRMINLSLISPEPGLRREAASQRQRNDNRSRTREEKSVIWRLRKQKEYAAAMKKVNDLIDREPFDAECLMIRASLNLRSDQVEAAFADVLEADRLSPGDVITESTIALIQVRLGQVAAGIAAAEDVRQRVPSSAGQYYGWTLYNTACVYGRAIELPDLPAADQQQYLDRAIELMHQAADAGIHDQSHVLNDPDLVALHDHPEWPSIIDQITTNQLRPR